MYILRTTSILILQLQKVSLLIAVIILGSRSMETKNSPVFIMPVSQWAWLVGLHTTHNLMHWHAYGKEYTHTHTHTVRWWINSRGVVRRLQALQGADLWQRGHPIRTHSCSDCMCLQPCRYATLQVLPAWLWIKSSHQKRQARPDVAACLSWRNSNSLFKSLQRNQLNIGRKRDWWLRPWIHYG